MEKKFEVKDLITIGIFTALYFVVTFVVACLGFVPIFMALMPLIGPIFAGIPLMLYFSKIKHFGMISVTSIIIAILMFITGHEGIVTCVRSNGTGAYISGNSGNAVRLGTFNWKTKKCGKKKILGYGRPIYK